MKIIIKTLSGQVFNIDIEPEDTVLQMKEKIKEVKQYDVALQKLFRKGTLLDDKTTAQELGLQDGEFIVIMVNIKKQAPPPQQPPQQQVQQPPVQQPVQPPQNVPPQVQPPQQAPQTNLSGESQLLSGPEYEGAIENMIGMGFSRDECVRAMKAAFNNPERAIDYLLNGIPAEMNVPPQQPTTQPQGTTGTGGQQGGQQQGAQQQVQGLGGLRQLFQQNPQAVMQLLPQIMQQIQQTNPQLYAQIQQNPEAMLQLLLGGGGGPQPQSTIQLTPEEGQQIETIMGMGFGKQDSLEAYLACDKNVEAALNYLFDKQARGDLLSQHIKRERENPENEPEGHGGDMEEEDDDGDIYQ